jgi:hypothetical protein
MLYLGFFGAIRICQLHESGESGSGCTDFLEFFAGKAGYGILDAWGLPLVESSRPSLRATPVIRWFLPKMGRKEGEKLGSHSPSPRPTAGTEAGSRPGR